MFRKIVILTAALLLLAASVNPAQAPRRIEITASRFSYTPNEITLKKGEPVVLVFHSTDVTHGFKLPEMNIKSDIKKGRDTEVAFTPTVAGHFVGKCAHFCGKGHGSMILQIIVVE
jgi:cytochrome c oxidase subunit 2